MRDELETKMLYIERYLHKQTDIATVSFFLKISKRQAYRLVQKYKEQGIRGLLHRSTGKPGHHRFDGATKSEILNLVKNKYFDCGPTLASELLQENEGIQIHRETLRLWMKDADLLNKTRKRKPYRQRRPRKESFGEMLQIDGSFHQWFGDKKTCLINLIDDTTNQNMCLFAEQETSLAAALLLWKWIQKYGVPKSIYCDRRNAYFLGDDKTPPGFFGQMCKNLKIQVIPAFSPQAKGRVERSNRTHQEWLIPMLRLYKITTIEQANKYIFANYLYHHNKKFALDTKTLDNKHTTLAEKITLNDVCFVEEMRKVNNDMTVSFKGKTLQITRKNYCPPKSTIIIRVYTTKKIQIFFKNNPLDFKIIS